MWCGLAQDSRTSVRLAELGLLLCLLHEIKMVPPGLEVRLGMGFWPGMILGFGREHGQRLYLLGIGSDGRYRLRGAMRVLASNTLYTQKGADLCSETSGMTRWRRR